MVENDNLRHTKIALNNGSCAIPALGFGTLIPDPIATSTATKAALEAGFRLLDAAERYRNEKQVGEAIQEVFKAGKMIRLGRRRSSGPWHGRFAGAGAGRTWVSMTRPWGHHEAR